MTRKDFRAIAEVLSQIRPAKKRREIARLFLPMLLESNPRFDCHIFLDYVEDESKELWLS